MTASHPVRPLRASEIVRLVEQELIARGWDLDQYAILVGAKCGCGCERRIVQLGSKADGKIGEVLMPVRAALPPRGHIVAELVSGARIREGNGHVH